MTDFRAWVATLPELPGAVRVEGGEIVLDHPSTRNALHPRMMVTLADAIAAWQGPAMIVRGAGDAFCSGGNLGVVRDHLAVAGAGAAFGGFMTGALDRLWELDTITIAAVTGPALGGGAELLATCDLVVAAPTATIGFVHARLGVSPGFGGGARLVARVGSQAALRLLVTAERVDAREALRIGLVDEIADDPVARARELADRIRSMPAESVAAGKRIAREGARGGFASARAAEAAAFAALWGGPAHRASLTR